MFKKIIAVVMLGCLSIMNAFAQVTTDPGVEAIEGLSAKGTSYITASFAVAVVIAGGFWGISMMKKAFSRAK